MSDGLKSLRRQCGDTAVILASLYIALTLVCGMILIVWDVRPARNDADQHWQRASLIAEGHFIAEESPSEEGHYGGYIDGEFVSFNNTAVNSPVAYFPSWFCGGHYRVASALTLLVAALLTGLGILLAGTFAPIIMATAILPMVFFSYIYPTADAMTNSTSLLFVGAVLFFSQHARKGKWSLVLLVLLGCVLGLVKVTCIILLLLLLLPFHKTYVRDGRLDWSFALPALAGILAAFIWSRFTVGIGPVYQSYETYQSGIGTILANPIQWVKTVVITTFCPLDYGIPYNDLSNISRRAQLFFGSEFTKLPATVMVPVLLGCAFLLLRGNEANRLFDHVDYAIILLTAILFFCGTHVAMLASWSAEYIGRYNTGLQTRYFIPALPLVGLLLPCMGIKISNNRVFGATTCILVGFGYIGLLIAHLMPL